MAKELVPIVVSCAVWGSQFARPTALLQYDSLGLVTTTTKGSSKDNIAMHLPRPLWFLLQHLIDTLSQNTLLVQTMVQLKLADMWVVQKSHHAVSLL